MMHPEPIVMTREEHMRHIASYWRQKDIKRLRDECIFEEEGERTVAVAIRDFDPWPCDERPIDWTIVRDVCAALILNFIGLAIGALFIWEMLRPVTQ